MCAAQLSAVRRSDPSGSPERLLVISPTPVRRPNWRLEEAHMEAIAFYDEVKSAVERIVHAATNGSRLAVINEANRLGFKAEKARADLLALKGSL